MLMRRPQVAPWQATLAGFLILVGFLVVLQLKAGRSIRQEVRLPTPSRQEMPTAIRASTYPTLST